MSCCSQVQCCSTVSSPNCPIPLGLVFPGLWCWSGWELKCQAEGNCHLAVPPYPAFCGTPVLAARPPVQSWAPCEAAPHSLCCCTQWLQGKLCSFTLLACPGLAASPDPWWFNFFNDTVIDVLRVLVAWNPAGLVSRIRSVRWDQLGLLELMGESRSVELLLWSQ